MAVKTKRFSLYKWHKFGVLSIYEGRTAIAMGSKTSGYSVFASKEGLQFGKEGGLSYKDKAGYMGIFATKGEASSLVREVDQTMETKGGVTTVTVTGTEGSHLEGFSQASAKTGGTLLFFEEGDTEARVHEGCHYLLGHLEKGRKKLKTGLKEEKEAVDCQIRWLKLRKEYTPKMRKSIIKNLATYFRSKDKKENLRQAEEFVREVET